MKVLVTGANGQVGRALLANAPEGWDVRGLTRAELDLTDPAAIRDLIAREQPDLLVNPAAYTAVDKAESEEDLARAINADAVAAMAEALGITRGRLVQVSTDFVFDGTASTPYAPDAPLSPVSAYGRTKAAGEQAAGPDALIVRTSWVHAAGGANFVLTMLRLMRNREELSVVADQTGSPTWASGLANVIWALAERGENGIWHHSDAGEATWHGFAEAIQEEALALGLLDRAIPIHAIATADYPTPAARPAYSVLDCSKTRAALGEAAHWRDNLRRMLAEENALG